MNAHELSHLEQLLVGALGSDNHSRGIAESSLHALVRDQRDKFIFGALQLLRTSQHIEARTLSAILLRQLLPRGETTVFDKLSEELQKLVKTELLNALIAESVRSVRRQVIETIAELGGVTVYPDKHGWDELYPALYTLCDPVQAHNAAIAHGVVPTRTAQDLQIAALSIFGKLTEGADCVLPQAEQLHRVFSVLLLKQTNGVENSLEVREAAAVACLKVIHILEEKQHTKAYQQFILPLLTLLSDLYVAEEESGIKRILSSICDICSEEASFFRNHVDELTQAMCQIGRTEGFDDGTRQYAVEVLCALAEGGAAMLRKKPSFLKNTATLCFTLMMDLEDDENWTKQPDTSELYDGSNLDCGEMALDRLAICIGPKLADYVMPMVEEALAKTGYDNWRYRHTGLRAFGAIAEILPFEKLPIRVIVKFAHDEHPRVRYSAIHCIGQVSNDFNERLLAKWNKLIYPALMAPLQDLQHPRNITHAAAALHYVIEATEGPILSRYLKDLMNLLCGLLQNGPRRVQESVMTTIAAVAGQCAEEFIAYYPHVVPLLKHIILHAHDKDNRMLRAKAMEAFSFIGISVGKDLFRTDALEVMQVFLDITHKVKVEDDDYTQQYMLNAWTRICNCLKEEFLPLLPYVIPPVFEAMSKNPIQVNRHALDDDDVDEHGNPVPLAALSSSSSSSSAGGASSSASSASSYRLGGDDDTPDGPIVLEDRALSAAMEEKVSACTMLCTFCSDLKEGFFPYIWKTAEIMIPLMDFPNAEVRELAISCQPHLVRCVLSAFKKGITSVDAVGKILQEITSHMLQIWRVQQDAEVLQYMITSLKDCLEDVGDELCRQCISSEQINLVGQALFNLLAVSHKRIEEREKLLAEEESEGDLDEERIIQIEGLNVQEDKLNRIVADCLGLFIRTHRELFIPALTLILPEIMRMVSLNSLTSTQTIGVYILDDIIEHLGVNAHQWYKDIIPPLLHHVKDQDAGLRQAAGYGLGVAAQFGKEGFTFYKEEAIKCLIKGLEINAKYMQRDANLVIGLSADDEGNPLLDAIDDAAAGPSAASAGAAPASSSAGDEEDDSYDDDDDDEEAKVRAHHSASDNIVAALVKICIHQQVPELINVWFGYLPIIEDDGEGPFIYSTICQLLESNNALLLGNNLCNLPKIIHVLLLAYQTTQSNKALNEMIRKLLFSMQQGAQAQALATILNSAPKHIQEKAQKVFTFKQ